MSVVAKFVLTIALIAVSMAAGYFARKIGLLSPQACQKLAGRMMTFVVVFGYTAVGFLTIWGLQVRSSDFWLPAMACLHVLIMSMIGIGAGRAILARKAPATSGGALDEDAGRAQVGLMSIASGSGNNGFTMGGFIIYLLLGEAGLGLVTIYSLAWTPMTVLLFYPVARHYATSGPPMALGRLMLQCVLDWRSIGLPITLAGLGLSLAGVSRPQMVVDLHMVDILVYTVTPIAYFAIGLRMFVADVWSIRRAIAALAGMRFIVAVGVGTALVYLVCLTPWPLSDLARQVFIIEAFVPTAVTMVAVANMFNLLPRQASVLFVANTMMYLLLVLPIVLWVYGR